MMPINNPNTHLIPFIEENVRKLNLDAYGITSVAKYQEYQQTYYTKTNRFNDPMTLFPSVQSILTAALNYNFKWNQTATSSDGYIARYTTANFYRILRNKLTTLGRLIKQELGQKKADAYFFKVYVNSSLNDKLSAYLSGIGGFLKNTLIDVAGCGSRCVLGILLLAIDLPINEIRKTDCGKCRHCITTCPTGALTENGSIRKEICLQHLSTELNWPDQIAGKSMLALWGTRFFGCTDCIDGCPKNAASKLSLPVDPSMPGYIGNTFDLSMVIQFKKTDYKMYFNHNQIGSGWVPVAALARNCLAALHNTGQSEIIRQFLENLDFYDWDNNEKKYLKNFCIFLLKNIK